MSKNWNISSHVMFCGNRSACPWWVRSDGTLSVSDSSWIDRQICFSGFEQNLHWMSSSSLWRTRCSLVFIHSPETKTEMFIFPSRWWRGLKLPHRWTSALENTQRFKLRRQRRQWSCGVSLTETNKLLSAQELQLALGEEVCLQIGLKCDVCFVDYLLVQ